MKPKSSTPKIPPKMVALFNDLNPKEQDYILVLFDLMGEFMHEISHGGDSKDKKWDAALEKLAAPLEPGSHPKIQKILTEFTNALNDIERRKAKEKAKKVSGG